MKILQKQLTALTEGGSLGHGKLFLMWISTSGVMDTIFYSYKVEVFLPKRSALWFQNGWTLTRAGGHGIGGEMWPPIFLSWFSFRQVEPSQTSQRRRQLAVIISTYSSLSYVIKLLPLCKLHSKKKNRKDNLTKVSCPYSIVSPWATHSWLRCS